MKMAVKSLSIAVLAVMFAFAFAGCKEDEESPTPSAVSTHVDTVVNIYAIQGVTVPEKGKTPVTVITENAQYRGTVKWIDNPSVFAASTEYTAIITLTAKSGFTLKGVPADFFKVTGAISVSNTANSGVVTALFPSTDAHVINITTIQGVTTPAKGGIPVTVITECEQYSGTVTWNGNPLTFAASTVYTAKITLTAKDGFTLQGVSANFFTVDGATSVNNAANSGDITAVFPSTDAHVVNISDIQGITVPVNGGVPVKTITENEQYSGTVTWNGNPLTFAASTEYTATIILTPKAGYTLQGVMANYFTVTGATSVSNTVNSGVITAIFPETDPTSINSVSIFITAPVKGATPNTIATANSTSNFSIGTVSWLPPGTSLFLGNKVYIAQVTLTADSGYTFTGLSSATINGQTATVADNKGSTVTLSYTFPATDTKTVTDITIGMQPNILTYTHGDTLDLEGLVVTLIHDDNTTEDVTAANFTAKNITANPANGNNLIYSTHNGQPIKITYGSLTKNTSNLTVNRATPTAVDFNISGTGTFTYDGNSKTVNITPKSGKTTGTVTVYYEGTGSTIYTKSTTAPSAVGTYTVTFDVAAATGYNSASGLSAGTLTIGKSTPLVGDFNISGTGSFYYDGSSKTVTITPKAGKTNGTITVKYNGSTVAPLNVGTYTVTFDVAAATNFNAASGLSAGTLMVNKSTPIVEDFNISGNGTFTYDGSPKIVNITPKEGKSTGTITVKYNGYTTVPSSVGTYTVTFDIATTTNYNAVNGLSAGTLTIATKVTFNSVTADGSASQSSTMLTLTFSQEMLTTNLSASDITLSGVSGVTKGNFISSSISLGGETDYFLYIYGFTAGGTLTVTVEKPGFIIIGTTKTVTIYYYYYNGVSPGAIEMASIPAGTFIMGSPTSEPEREDNETQHSVTLSSFKMSKYQVTQEQYQAVMGSNPSYNSSPPAGETQGKLPVEGVSWYDAIIFYNKLSMLEGLSPAYRISGSTDPAVWGTVPTSSNATWNAVEIVAGSNGYRLPTEAQWEYACRAGTTTAYNTGDTISDNTGWWWHQGDLLRKKHEVGLKPANAWGLYDMHGNVWEWCWDWYGTYPSTSQTDPKGAAAGSHRVARGGSYNSNGLYLRSSCRGYYVPYGRYNDIGFRLVRP